MSTQKVMLITGASRGIGAATAALAASAGYAVVVNYRVNHEAANALVHAITSGGGSAIAVQADVSDEQEIGRLFARVDQAYGRLDVLVNNAGTVDRASRVQDMTAARLSRMFQVNITGPFLCAREAVRRMSTASGGPGGVIVNVSSGASRTGSPNEYVDYAASKGAVDTFTVGLAREVGAEGIRVAAVRPGIIDTDFHARAGEPGRAERLASTIPLCRSGSAEEVARAILWLAAPASAYSTGALLDVSGGR